MNKSRLFISWELSAPISKVYICSRIGFSNCLDIKNGLRLPCIASNDLGIKSVLAGSLAWYELSLVGRKMFLFFLVVVTREIENWAMDIVERIFGISLTISYSCWDMSFLFSLDFLYNLNACKKEFSLIGKCCSSVYKVYSD